MLMPEGGAVLVRSPRLDRSIRRTENGELVYNPEIRNAMPEVGMIQVPVYTMPSQFMTQTFASPSELTGRPAAPPPPPGNLRRTPPPPPIPEATTVTSKVTVVPVTKQRKANRSACCFLYFLSLFVILVFGMFLFFRYSHHNRHHYDYYEEYFEHCDFEYGWNYYGNDIGHAKNVRSEQECYETCQNTDDCYCFTWHTRYNWIEPNTCWLKGKDCLELKSRKQSNEVISGVNCERIKDDLDIHHKPEHCEAPHLLANGKCDNIIKNDEACEFDEMDCKKEIAEEICSKLDIPSKESPICDHIDFCQPCGCLKRHIYHSKEDLERILDEVSGKDLTQEVSEACPFPEWVGDGFCDWPTNVQECNYDGGDCCGDCYNCICKDPEVLFKDCPHPDYAQNGNCDDITNTPECLYDNKNCCENDFHHTGDSTCLDPYPHCPAEFVQLIGNGYCDDVTNRIQCGFDGGDCCKDEIVKGICHDCFCLSECQGPPHFYQDHMCDESLNNEKCNYDGGDCCALDSLKHPHFCGDCLCHKPELYVEYFPNCSLSELKKFRNGHCDESLLSFDCGFDAGDCCDAENVNEYGNGICNRELNNGQCLFDGLDCCMIFAEQDPEECDDCLCEVPQLYSEVFKHCPLEELKKYHNGHCDGSLNNPQCGFDGGDCCDPGTVKDPDDCQDCRCKEDECPLPYLSFFKFHNPLNDSYCNDDLNHEGCGFDGMDCCLDNPESKSICQDCQCKNPTYFSTTTDFPIIIDIITTEVPECEFEDNYDYWCDWGHDIHLEDDVQSAKDCFELCKEFPGCYGFSWAYVLRQCWLKDEHCLENKMYSLNVVSGLNCHLWDEAKPEPATDFPYFIGIVTSSTEWPLDWHNGNIPENCKTKNPDYFHDDLCDDDLNNEECHFDGGDCCLFTEDSHQYCNECHCIMENHDYATGNETDLLEWTQDLWNSTNEIISSLTDLLSPGGWPSPSLGGVTSSTPGPTTTPAPSPPMVSSGVSEENFTTYNGTSIIKMLLTRVKQFKNQRNNQ